MKPTYTRFFARLVSVLVLVSPSIAGLAQPARTEIIPIQTVTMTDQEFLTGHESGRPATIAGELRLPRNTSDRLPVVILLHGSGGISSGVTDWEHDLLEMGVATFVLDSFSGRSIINTNNDQAQLPRLAQTEDAYRALAVLSRHPRINPAQIILMGFSRGGQNALYASLKRFHRLHASPGTQFAAYIAFYPDCTYTYQEDDRLVDKPVRIFQGGADNYNPVVPCRAYVGRLRATGNDVQLTEYSGAHHLFDSLALRPLVQLPQAQTTRNCREIEQENGLLVNAKTREPFTYNDPCVERGVTVGYDEPAARQARQAVHEIVARMLAPSGTASTSHP